MPLPHAWIRPDGTVLVPKFGHKDILQGYETFEDYYRRGWIRIGRFGTENFAQGRASDIALHKDVIGYMLQPGENIRIAFDSGGVIWVTTEQFWEADIEGEAERASLFSGYGNVNPFAQRRVRRHTRSFK